MKELIGMAVLFWPLTLIVLVFVAFAVVISVAVVFAARTGRSKWRWAMGGFLLVYLPIFWDWIPTVAMHQYYCATEAGFWVYKTLDQWKAENPGVAEALVANEGAPFKSGRFDDEHGYGEKRTYFLNDRFNWIVIQQDISSLLPFIRTEQQVLDVKKNEVLARYVDFGTGNSVEKTIGPPGPLKFWLSNQHCRGGAMNDGRLYHFFSAAKHIGEGEKK
jgi:hypothetical protein